MASSNVVKNFVDGTLVVRDGSVVPLNVTVRFDRGDLAISGLKQKLRETVAYETRGVTRTVRHTNRAYPSGSFSCLLTQFVDTGGTSAQLADMIHGTTGSGFAARVSTLGTLADVMAFDLRFTAEGTNFGDSADHLVVLEDCELSYDFAEGDPDSLTFNFVCYGAISGDLTVTV